MRTALVCPYALDLPGGVARHIFDLAANLRERGDDVVVVGPLRRGSAMTSPRGTHVASVGRAVPMRWNGSVANLCMDPLAPRRFRVAMQTFRPDVIHIHEPGVPTVGLGATKSQAAPIVATFHSWSDSTDFYRRAYKVVKPVVKPMDNIVEMIAVSQAAVSYHSRALGRTPSEFAIIPNGVDVKRFRDVEPHPGAFASPLIVFVGRLEPRKGVEPLIKAYTRLMTRRPDVRLAIVGDGPLLGDLKRLLPDRLRKHVQFPGMVSDRELPQWYAAADVVVSPALGGESFGIVIAEALAAGKPVVASDLPGFRAPLGGGAAGLLVEPGNVSALADALERALTDATLRARLVSAAAERADDLDWGNVATRIRAVYDRAIAGGPAWQRDDRAVLRDIDGRPRN